MSVDSTVRGGRRPVSGVLAFLSTLSFLLFRRGESRRPRRPGFAVALSLLAAALLALAGGAQAQDQTVVENLAQGGNQVLELNRVAQTFETGSNTGGYTVTHIRLKANAAPHPAGTSSTLRAMLCNVDSSGKPPDNLGFCTWTGTVRFFDAGDLDFELERSVRLLPNTKYAVVAQRTAGAKPPLSATASGSADSASSAEWDIGAGGLPWQWAMTRRQNGTFHERWERVPWQRYLRFGLYGRFNLLNEPNRGNPPVFRDDDGLVELTIAENEDAGANVGRRLSDIVDRRGQTVTYRIVPDIVGNEIGGPDGDLFDIDPRNGQITAKQSFDFESAKEYYQFGVSASNAIGASAGVNVRVRVTDVDEPPEAYRLCDGVSDGGRNISCENSLDPSEFWVRARSDTEIKVTWERERRVAGVPPIHTYTVLYRGGTGPLSHAWQEAGVFNASDRAPTGGLQIDHGAHYAFTIGGLQPVNQYEVQLRVTNLNRGLALSYATVTTHAHPQYAFRLSETDGRNPQVGRPEFFFRGKWGTVTDHRADNAGNESGALMCRLAGFDDGEYIAAPGSQLGSRYRSAPAGMPIWLDDLRCAAGDTDINQCSHAGWGESNGDHSEDLWVRCWNGTPNTTSTLPERAWIENGTASWLYIQFDTTLESGSGKTPGKDRFQVDVAAPGSTAFAPVAVNHVEVFPNTGRVRLSLPREIAWNEAVKVGYADPNPLTNDATGVLEDRFGRDAEPFQDYDVDNEVRDEIPPNLTAGETSEDGKSVTVWFTEPLDRDTKPDPERFTVRVTTRKVVADEQGMGTSVDTDYDAAPSTVAFATAADLSADARSRIAGKSACSAAPHTCALVLTMSERDRIRGQDLRTYNFENGSRSIPIRTGHRAVKVGYADPSSANDAAGVVQDPFGNDARTSHFATVKNRTTYGRGLLPVAAFVSAEDASTTNLVFEWPLSDEDFPSSSELLSAFSITAGGSPATDLSVTRDSNADNRLIFEHHALTPGDIVTISYTKPTSGNILKDGRGIEVASFTAYPVGNPDSPIVLETAVITGERRHIIELSFNQDLDPRALPPTDSFRARSEGGMFTHTVGRIEFDSEDASKLRVFTDSHPLGARTGPYTISYTRPANDGLRSVHGVEVLTFSHDIADIPTLSITGMTVTQGTDATADFMVRLSRAVTETVTVDYFTRDGTATAGEDYVATSGTLTFTPGETEKTVSVTIIDDSEQDDGEWFTLRISDHSTNVVLFSPFGRADINGRGPRPIGAFVTPGDQTATTLVFEWALSDEDFPSGSELLSAFSMTADGSPVTGLSVSRDSNAGNRLVLGHDSVPRGVPVTISYAKPTSGNLLKGDRGKEVLSFTDFPAANPPLPLALQSAVILSDPRTMELRFTGDLDPTVVPPTDSFRARGGEINPITNPVDRIEFDPDDPRLVRLFAGFSPFTLGGTPRVIQYTRPANGGLRSAGGVEVLDFLHNVTLASQPLLTVDDVTVTEGEDATADFTVRLTPAATATVTVDYATEDVSAMEPGDYTATSGTLTFDAGETEKTVSVPIVDDSVEDDGETFNLRLSNPSGGDAVLAPRTAGIALIRNDEGGTPAVTPLTAAFTGAPAGHGGQPFTVELAFSEELALSYKLLQGADGQASVVSVAGGAVTRAARVAAGENRRWTLTVEPDGSDDVTLTLPATTDCEAADAICTEDDRPLAAAVAATVPNAAPSDTQIQDTPFTVRLAGVPAEHDGESAVSFEVHFSEEPHQYSFRALRDETLDIRQGGTRLAPYVKRKNKPSNRAWTVTVEPASKADLTVAIAATESCTDAGAVCNGDGEALSNAVSATVLGPPGLSVADARVEEAAGAVMDFAVTMSRASTATVTVDYATSDGTATAGADYTASSGTLSFAPGETSKTVSVPVLDDAHDDGGETFALTLSNVSGGNAWLEDASATGTIENADAMPRAWIARFGRTVGTQAVEAVTGRMGGGGGTHVTLGGRSLPLGTGEASLLTDETTPGDDLSPMAHGGTGEVAKEAGEVEKAVAEWLRSSMGEDGELVLPDLDTLMLGSSFNLSLGDRGAGPGSRKEWSVWGRFARDSFEGAAEGLSLEGDVTTGFVGMDVETGSWLWGAALGISDGEGPYRMAEDGATAPPEDETPGMSGRMESNMTAVYPYGRYAVTDRLDLWAMGGYGEGTMTVEAAGGSPLETDLGMTLGAVGARGTLREPPPEGGIALILRADALWVRTETEALRSEAGFLSAATADTSRMRLILEGERAYRLTNGGTLTPALELGVRRDGGDAETGTGIETGARVSFKRQGLTIEGAVRTLLSHEDEEYGEWGASASIRLEPGRDGRGLSFSVAPSWGTTGSAAERLWGLDDTRGLAPDGEFEAGRRIDARVGYGLPVSGGRFTGTPELGMGLSDGVRDYRIGWRLSPVGGGIGPFASFGIHVEAARKVPSRGESESRFGVVLEARF